MLAVAVLIIVMSIMTGFRTELLSRMLAFNGHMYVQRPGAGRRRTATRRWQRIREVPGVVQVTPLIEAQAMVTRPTARSTGAVVRGIAPAGPGLDAAASTGNIDAGARCTASARASTAATSS